jgi:DNA-binding NarL/FixJ family response regulator
MIHDLEADRPPIEILAYAAKGNRDKVSPEKFLLSVDTVRTRLRKIYKKLHVRLRTEALLKFLPADHWLQAVRRHPPELSLPDSAPRSRALSGKWGW